MTKPLPMPATSRGRAIAQPTLAGSRRSTTSTATSPITTVSSPATISGLPSTEISRPPIAEVTAEPSANGVRARPASSGVNPRPCCRKSVRTKKIEVNPAK